MSKQPETLQIFAVENVKSKDVGIGNQAPTPPPLTVATSETINTKDVGPGNPGPTKEQLEEKLPPEEFEKRQKIMVEYTRLSGRYCLPHNKKSRWVTSADLPKSVADARDMVAMCHIPRGKYSGIAALAHSQIEDKDPLRFFVLPTGMVVINPVITNHTRIPVFKEEGCMSHIDKEPKKMIPRFNKITVIYQTLIRKDEKSDPILSKPTTEELSGGPSHTFQHEVSHLNGISIYDEGFTAESCEWLGKGPMTEKEVKNLYKTKE